MRAARRLPDSPVRAGRRTARRPVAGLLVLALALGSGVPGAAAGAVIEIQGGVYGPPGPTNATTLDYLLIDAAAQVEGDVTNTSTGTILGDADHDGVAVYNGSTVSGAIINQGTIGAGDLANYAIVIRDSTITGGIDNQGTAASADTAILVDVLWAGAFSGSITNSGTVSGGGAGIAFQGESLAGGIANSGTITSVLTGISVDIAAATADGGTLAAGLVNAGSVASQDNAGIRVYAGTLDGGLRNTASGRVSAPSDHGIYLDVGAIGGGLSNAGLIESGGTGLEVRGETLDGGVANTGTLTSTGGDGIVLSLAAASGAVVNAGSIVADGGDGLRLSVASAADGVTNTGSIQAIAGGVVVDSGSALEGDIHNAAGAEIRAGVGIDLIESSVGGTLTNAGKITAGSGIAISAGAEVAGGLRNDGIIDADVSIAVSADSVSGTVVNTGALIGALSLAGTDASGDGIDLLNSGTIDLGMASLGPSLISGDYTQTAGGSLALTLLSFADYAGDAPLSILGDMDIAGELLLGLDSGFSFVAFERLTLIGVGATRTGFFANYADDALVMGFGARGGLYIDYTDAGIDLYTTPLPATWLLIGIGLIAWRGRAARRGPR